VLAAAPGAAAEPVAVNVAGSAGLGHRAGRGAPQLPQLPGCPASTCRRGADEGASPCLTRPGGRQQHACTTCLPASCGAVYDAGCLFFPCGLGLGGLGPCGRAGAGVAVTARQKGASSCPGCVAPAGVPPCSHTSSVLTRQPALPSARAQQAASMSRVLTNLNLSPHDIEMCRKAFAAFDLDGEARPAGHACESNMGFDAPSPLLHRERHNQRGRATVRVCKNGTAPHRRRAVRDDPAGACRRPLPTALHGARSQRRRPG